MAEGRIRCHFICGPGAQARSHGPGPAARFGAELKALLPGRRLVAAGAHEVELTWEPWSIEAAPAFLRLGHDGLGVDWGEFQRLAGAVLEAYLRAFEPGQVEAATLGRAVTLGLPPGAQGLGQVFRVYPILAHPLADRVEGFRLAATFHAPHPDELFRVYLAGHGGTGQLGVTFELDYTRHFRRSAVGEVVDWLGVAPLVLRELLLGSVLEPGVLGF